MLKTIIPCQKTARFFVVLATSSLLVASSCKSRTFNKIIGNDSSDDEANRSDRGSSPDGCAKLKLGSRIAVSATPEIRVRDAYTPMSLVQSERRYLISFANKTVQTEETPVGDTCCEKRGTDSLITKSLSTEQVKALQQALDALTLASDLRCANEAEVKAAIQKMTCDSQAGYTLLIDEGRVIPDSQSCLPSTKDLWGQANGLANIANILKNLPP